MDYYLPDTDNRSVQILTKFRRKMEKIKSAKLNKKLAREKAHHASAKIKSRTFNLNNDSSSEAADVKRPKITVTRKLQQMNNTSSLSNYQNDLGNQNTNRSYVYGDKRSDEGLRNLPKKHKPTTSSITNRSN